MFSEYQKIQKILKILGIIFGIFVLWGAGFGVVDVFSKSRFGWAHYDRKEWHHWIDADHNCLDTRAEILKNRSTVPVKMNKKGCKILQGSWPDYYYPEILTKVKHVDIDHLVPLKHAHENGGYEWSQSQKEAFANDPENLVITNKKYNRSKGSKGIDRWLPKDHDYACKYEKDWVKVKVKYNLHFTAPEIDAIKLMQPSCPGLTYSN